MQDSSKELRRSSRGKLALSAAILVLPLAWFVRWTLLAGHTFAFRDVSHYYYPLLKWTAAQWGQGRLPIWNPLDNCGTPAVAEATYALFYPGKLLFALPLPFTTCCNCYVLVHLIVACAGTFLVARRWGCSQPAACLAAMSYAYSGYVLFQHCNLIYLTSAAWLPLAIGFTETMLRKPQISSASGLAAVLALMILGGDPHTAYNVLIIFALLIWPSCRLRMRETEPPTCRPSAGRSAVWFGLVSLATCGLAAIQVVPSIQWAPNTQRAVYEDPRSVYEMAASWREGRSTSSVGHLVRTPEPHTHKQRIYQFSIPAWRMVELVWPNASGRLFPTHHRWVRAAFGEPRVWTPSLYMGLLPIAMALAALGTRQARAIRVLLVVMIGFGVLGSWGYYGVGWLSDTVARRFADDPSTSMAAPVGGLYWWLVTVMPGYAYFRYPAKLWVFAGLGLSLLAGLGLDRFLQAAPDARIHRNLSRGLMLLASSSIVAAVAVWQLRVRFFQALKHARPDDLFGDFHPVGAVHDLLGSLVHAAIVGGVLIGLLALVRLRLNRWFTPLALIITAVDLCVANTWLVPTVPRDHLEQPIELGTGDVPVPPMRRVFRTSRVALGPPNSTTRPIHLRHSAAIDWQRESLFGGFHLPREIGKVGRPGPLASADHLMMFSEASRQGLLHHPDGSRNRTSLCYALSVDTVIDQPSASSPVVFSRIATEALPRCWITRDVVSLPPLARRDPNSLRARTLAVLVPDGKPSDLRQTAFVETSIPLPELEKTEQNHLEQCRIVSDQPAHIEIEVLLAAPALVVLNDSFANGWIAYTGDTAGRRTRHRLYRTNRVMRGVLLPPGKHRLTLTYRPAGLYGGAVVSGLGWVLFIVSWTGRKIRRRKNRTPRKRRTE